MKEIHLQRAIVETLNYNHCLVWRTNSGLLGVGEGRSKRMVRVGYAGQSDIQGIHKLSGRFIAIEVKLPETRNRVSDLQQQFLDNIFEAGGIVGVATSTDEALAIIKEYERKSKNAKR